MKKLHQLMGKISSIIMAGSNSHITILNLNINDLNAPIKRHTGKLDEESRTIGVLYLGDPSYVQRHT